MIDPTLQIRTDCRAGQTTVTLVGELDLDSAQQLRAALADCLARRPQRLWIDLRALAFCDCAGLNVLLETRQSAVGLGTELFVRGSRGQVARLFAVLGVDETLAGNRRRLPPRTA